VNSRIPAWFTALVAIALLSVSALALREAFMPGASWIMLERLGPSPSVGYIVLNQRTGTWCIIVPTGSPQNICHEMK
jgi:hypothetical protein